MSGKTSSVQVSAHSFYGESPPKRSRLQDSNTLRPAFKSLKDNLKDFEKKIEKISPEPSKSSELKEPAQNQEIGDEPKSLDRDSPLPLKNLGNTCYENSIIQCLFSLNMFMDNFERSIKKMRQFVVKSTVKTLDAQGNGGHTLQQKPSQQAAPTNTVATITENDVRYRIADAFDNLYKSYTQKRIQTENNTQSNQDHVTKNIINHDDRLDGVINNPEPDFDIIMSHASVSSPSNVVTSHPATSRTCSSENQTSATASTTDIATSNLTPIALVSSAATSNEQSEIETRLEDLKSAVGERSSQFNSTHQQDASEFFYHVIDSIQEFYQGLNMTNDEDNPVTKAFELELDYLIRCPKCHNRFMISEPEKIRTLPLALPHVNNNESSTNQEEYNHETGGAPTPPTSDLGIDSPESNNSEEHKNGLEEKENLALVNNEVTPEDNSNNTMSIANLDIADKTEQTPQQKHYTLRDALNNYFKDDLLDYSCSQPGCDSKQRTKKCLIRKLPQVLFITLARYSYTGKKNLDEIEAPIELSVPFRENKSPGHSPSIHREHDEDENKYQLVAVVCHLGSSLNAGHYTSYVYNQNNFSWYSCDDDSITKVQETEVRSDATKSGYCFFYAHKSCVNQIPDRLQQEESNQREERLLKKGEATNVLVSSSVVDSSVCLTPESSPTPSVSSHDEVNMHDGHTCCANRANDVIDDWS